MAEESFIGDASGLVDGWDIPAPGKKRIVILTSGSRGDTQPFIALALACKAEGHAVRLAVEERLKPLVQGFGLNYFKIAGDPTAVLWEQEAQEWLREGKVMQLMSKMDAYIQPYFKQALEDYEKACEGAEVVVSAPLCFHQTYCIAEKNNVPYVAVLLGATLKTGDFPLFFLMQTNLGIGFINRATYNLMFWMLWSHDKAKLNEWRQSHLKLPPITFATGVAGFFEDYPDQLPIVLAFNRNAIPTRKLPADYPKSAELCGFFFVPSTPEEKVAHDLREFVHKCQKKPLYLGFGSMPAPQPKALLNLAVLLVEKLDCPAILCAGWSSLTELIAAEGENAPDKVKLPSTLLIVKEAPHDWLFPRCSAIIHHCGIGTTAASLRSGTPSVPCPVMLDQPYNASQIHSLGVGTVPIPFAELTAAKLIKNIQQVLASDAMRQNAKAIADEIAQEERKRGVAHAVKIIENAKTPRFWKRS